MEVLLPPLDGDASDPTVVDFLKHLLILHRPTVIVEAGTYLGHFALVAAAFLKTWNVDGHVYTADPKDYGMAAYIEANGLRHHLTYHQGDFGDLFLLYPDLQDGIDFAYVDSGAVVEPGGQHLTPVDDDGEPLLEHTHMRWNHYLMARINLRPGGLVVVDDTNGDWQRVQDIKDQASLVLTGARGLSIFQKPYD